MQPIHGRLGGHSAIDHRRRTEPPHPPRVTPPEETATFAGDGDEDDGHDSITDHANQGSPFTYGRSSMPFDITWEWNTTTILATSALVVSGLSYLRARAADRRTGAALLESQIVGQEIDEIFYGHTRLKVTNTGPAIASTITVIIWEGKEDTEARAGFRKWRHRWRLHRTSGPKICAQVPVCPSHPHPHPPVPLT